jgi:holliday junction DNA helicase RuvA
MYNHLKGAVAEVSPTRIVVDVGGVGYDVTVPLSVSRRAAKIGGEIRLLTHLVVREDSLQLVGFLDEEERRLFRTLINLQGVGPALALRVLSSCTPQEFAVAVERQDAASLRRIKGVGEKTAKRIILELKGAKTVLPAGVASGAPSGPATDAVMALEAMGVPQREAVERVEHVLAEEPGLALEELVKRALR